MAYEAEILCQLVEGRIRLVEAYREIINKMLDDPTIPVEAIERLQAERDQALAYMTQQIEGLRYRIAKL